MTHYRISLSYAVFGITANDGKVIEAAPIGKWMVGKQIEEVIEWVRKKAGTIDLY